MRTAIHDENLRLIISKDFYPGNKIDINQIFDRTYISQLSRKDSVGLGQYIVQLLMKLQHAHDQAEYENV
ncbi:hypothetical protein JL979_11070 [Staphylococcus pseudintermedius]|nr:hypothetical protein [Staphylococcus pseudintermedius]MCE5502899.1 hypothetical protein [Staphylococcus pseudintermedius]MCE5524662.1 hypothetical protein [Staphylococcus pseudintermedius]MCE5619141.1 hypothetical protein [Staphylococcus pseudintermedius]MCE5783874.1 hypothetical protein [Staphylococcus pseudintermedius]